MSERNEADHQIIRALGIGATILSPLSLQASEEARRAFEKEYFGQWPTFTEETLERFRDHRERLIAKLGVLLKTKPRSRFIEVPFPPGDRDFVVFDTQLRIFTEARVKVLDRPVNRIEMYRVKEESFRTLVVALPKELSDGKG